MDIPHRKKKNAVVRLSKPNYDKLGIDVNETNDQINMRIANTFDSKKTFNETMNLIKVVLQSQTNAQSKLDMIEHIVKQP